MRQPEALAPLFNSIDVDFHTTRKIRKAANPVRTYASGTRVLRQSMGRHTL